MWVINRLPAVKIVNLRHVSKQNVSLAAEDRGQKPWQSWVVHLGPITLQQTPLRKYMVYAYAMLLGVVYLLVNQPQLFLCDKGEKCVFSPAELTAALPHRFFLSLWVPSSHDWGTQRESQRASLAPNKENHKVNSIKSRTEDKQMTPPHRFNWSGLSSPSRLYDTQLRLSW